MSQLNPYFKKKFDEEITFNENHVKVLKLPNISVKVFNVIIIYIYGGKFSLEKLENSDIFDLLIASNELELDELVAHLQTRLFNNNASWLRLNFDQHPSTIFESENFYSLTEGALISILKRDNLQLEEGKIWEYVIGWGKAKNTTLPTNLNQWTRIPYTENSPYEFKLLVIINKLFINHRHLTTDRCGINIDEMVRIVASLRESFEECAIQLLHYTPQDEIDNGMFCLFTNKSDLKELFAALNNLDEKFINLWDKLSRLQELYMLNVQRFIDKCWKDALIEKMIEFEKKGIPSTSPFSKFIPNIRRQMEKSCWPNLVKIKDKLIITYALEFSFI
ncbi:hypothetical protein Glove_37g184 [Diversispora epigaea]|uniref:BTB domain-containing protein n=1 Tax=Diversispora epigaea TaxID=1348612 RepID=A0A397JQ09_9GLOM|nr:hypothetical protein Glove_37g184 [Diversispora epigaea]